MPTFTAIALDRLLEPGISEPVDKSISSSNPNGPVPTSNLERIRGLPVPERKITRPQISPALYATPQATPLPDSPSSFTPSPYIVNHKRRGPRLLKSHSVDNVASSTKDVDEDKVNGSGESAENKVVDSNHSVTFCVPISLEERNVIGVANGVHGASGKEQHANGLCNDETGSGNGEPKSRDVRDSDFSTMDKVVLKPITSNSERDSELDDFFDPPESIGYASNTDCEDNSVTESSIKFTATTLGGEFFDAWEELSSDGSQQSSLRDVEAELHGMRLNLLMEIEKRKQAEETLNSLQSHWQRIKEQLAHVGLTLPAFPSGVLSPDVDPAAEMCRQVYLARFVSDSIGRGIGKAEVEKEKDAQIEAKNFEIARLLDRLHYYETVNREMSQRNQESVEMARRNRQVRKRKQRWVWGSLAIVITLGTAALVWSYIPPSKGEALAVEHDNPAE